MAFKDIQFPQAISFHAIGGPGFLTNVVVTNSGNEFRDQVWSLERGEWQVSHAARTPAVYKPLQAFFRNVRGRAYSFRFKDWSDFEATVAEGIFVLEEGSPAVSWQMWKRYTFDGETFDRKITKPVNGTISITGSFSAIDYTTGLVTGTPTAWAGEFDCHARFDTDKMTAETIDRSSGGLIIGWSSIPVIEIK